MAINRLVGSSPTSTFSGVSRTADGGRTGGGSRGCLHARRRGTEFDSQQSSEFGRFSSEALALFVSPQQHFWVSPVIVYCLDNGHPELLKQPPRAERDSFDFFPGSP